MKILLMHSNLMEKPSQLVLCKPCCVIISTVKAKGWYLLGSLSMLQNKRQMP